MQKSEFIARVLGSINDLLPAGACIEKTEHDLVYTVKFANTPPNTGMKFSLVTPFEQAQRGNEREVGQFMRAMETEIDRFVQQIEGKSTPKLDMNIVFPVIRKQLKETSIIQERLDEKLAVCCVEDHEHATQFITRGGLPDGITVEDVQKTAIQNLRKRGWKKPDTKHSLMHGSKIMVFDSTDPYHYQFFDPSLRNKHLPGTFYLCLATNRISVVLVPPNNGAAPLDDMLAAQQLVSEIINSEPKVIDPEFRRMKGKRH